MDRRKFTKRGVELISMYLASGVLVQCTTDEVAPTKRLALTGSFTGEFLQDSVYQLTWEAQYVNQINIELLPPRAADWIPLATNLPADNREFQWEIGDTSGQDFRLRISDTENEGIFTESPPFSILKTAAIDLGDAISSLDAGESVILFHPRVGEVAIGKTAQNTFTSLNLQCPHNGCRVDLSPVRQDFACPCHGSTFSATGCLLTGPAEEGLTAYKSEYVPERQLLLLILSGARPAC